MPLIFMSHRIRDKKPDGPVIVVQSGKQQIHTNSVAIKDNDGMVVARIKFDLKPCPQIKTHEVRAWVEVYNKNNVEFEL